MKHINLKKVIWSLLVLFISPQMLMAMEIKETEENHPVRFERREMINPYGQSCIIFEETSSTHLINDLEQSIGPVSSFIQSVRDLLSANLKDFELEYATYKSKKDELFLSNKWSDEDIHQYELWIKLLSNQSHNSKYARVPHSQIVASISMDLSSTDQKSKLMDYLQLKERVLFLQKLKEIEDHLKGCFEFYNNIPCLAQKIMLFISCVESLLPMGLPYIEFPDNALLSIHMRSPEIPERREIKTIVAITEPTEGWTDDHRKRFKEQYNQDPIDFIAIQEAEKKARQEKMEKEIQQATLACHTLKEIHKDFALLARGSYIHFHQLKVTDYLCDYLLWLPLVSRTLEDHPLIKVIFEPYTLLFPESFQSQNAFLWLQPLKKDFIDNIHQLRRAFMTLLTTFKQASFLKEMINNK